MTSASTVQPAAPAGHASTRSLLRSRLSDEQAQGIVREAVDIERRFVCEQLPLAAIGLECAAMEQVRGCQGGSVAHVAESA